MSDELEVAGMRPLGSGTKEPEQIAAEEPSAPVQAAPEQFDFKQFGDEFDSPDKLKSFIESSREVNKKVESYEKEISSLKSQTPYADEALYKLDWVKRNNPEKFDLAKDLLFGKIDDLSVVRLGLEYDDPVLQALDPEDRQAYLESKYNLSKSLVPLKEEDGYSEKEIADRNLEIAKEEKRIRSEKVMLAIDAAKARQSISDKLFAGIQMPKLESKEEAEKRQAEAVGRLAETWREPLKKVGELKSVPIETWDAKEEKSRVAFEMQVPEPALKKYMEELNTHIVQNGWTPEQVSVADAQAFIAARFREDNLPKIIHEASVKARNMSNEEWQKFFFNSQRPANPVDVPGSKGTTRTTEDSFRRAIGQA